MTRDPAGALPRDLPSALPRDALSRAAGSTPGPRPVRVGGIDYLNALPLTRYLTAAPAGDSPEVIISNHPPSTLADMLRRSALDVALVPVVEYLARPEYRIVPGSCISSYGEVRSIRLFHRCPLREARLAGMDSSSRTSALLTRLLFRELWKGEPDFVDLAPEKGLEVLEGKEAVPSVREAGTLDTVLLIGDPALRVRPPAGWDVADLGTEWTRWTGLPFVYAFWVWRGGPAPRGLARLFERARAAGTARIDDIVAAAKLPGGMDPVEARDYLRRVIQYDLGPLQLEGLALFFSRLHGAGLIPAPPPPPLFLPADDDPAGGRPS